MILPIALYGDPVLRQKNKEIRDSFIDLKSLISNMFETMYQADGVGLAAPQLSLNIRLFIVDTSSFIGEDTLEFIKHFKRVFINPKIIKSHGSWKFKEGCLSIPGIRENIDRPEYIQVKYYNENWEKCEETLKGAPARVVQHEYDHLGGKLFIDYISPMKRQMISKKLEKISKGMIHPEYKVKFYKQLR